MSRRTPPNNKMDGAKMDIKQSDIKPEKEVKTEDADDGNMASSSGSGSGVPPVGGGSGGGAQGGPAASGPASGSGGSTGSNSSPGSPRVTLRLPPSATRTPEKAGRSASDNKSSEAGSDDPYEFKCKDEPGHGTAGGTQPGGGADTPSKGGDSVAGEERGDKRPAAEEDDEGEQAKKKKRKEDTSKEPGTGGGASQGGKGVNRGGRATGEKSSKPTARSGPLHGTSNPGFSAGVTKTSAGNGPNNSSTSSNNNSGFVSGQSTTPASSATSSVSNSSLASSTSNSSTNSNNSNSNVSNSSTSNNGSGSSLGSLDVNRKSPLISASNSPKSSIKQEKCEDGSDEEGSRPDTSSAGGGGGGPKVPPLKIVLSSCGGGSSNTSSVSSQEQEQSGPQTGKSTNARHLPYVVPANQADQSVKEETASSPSDCKDASHVDEPLSPGGSTGGEKSAPRITRSQRGTGSNSADEGSGAVKVEVKQEDHATVTTTSSSSAGTNIASNSSSSNTNGNNNNNGGSSTNSTSSSTTTVTAPTTTTTTTTSSSNNSSSGGSSSSGESVHPRKRKLNIKEEEPEPSQPSPPEQPLTNCYQMFLKIRKQIDDRRKLLFPVQPKPPQGFKDYLMNRGTYVLAGNPSSQQSVPIMDPPTTLSQPLKDLFTEQERDRYKLRLQHQIEREKLVLSVEQEILREHGRAARALANQALPFSACTVLRDQEVYNILTPEQEEKHRNARSRYNGRLFLSWLQDVDDKWEKIKESMVLRQQNEAESLNAVHRMDWEWKMKELGLCDNKSRPVIEDLHVPTVAVSDFDLLPA